MISGSNSTNKWVAFKHFKQLCFSECSITYLSMLQELRFPYTRPCFLQLNTEDEILASADHAIRPILCPRDITRLPWNLGYAEWVPNTIKCHLFLCIKIILFMILFTYYFKNDLSLYSIYSHYISEQSMLENPRKMRTRQ